MHLVPCRTVLVCWLLLIFVSPGLNAEDSPPRKSQPASKPRPADEQPLEALEPPPVDPNYPQYKMLTTEEALKLFQKRVEQQPQDYLSRTQVGRFYVRLARETGNEDYYDKAEAELRKVLETYPKSTSARTYLALALMARHKFREALELAQAVYRDDPRNTQALATIGDAHLELGQYDEAEKVFGQLEKKLPIPVPEVLARLGRIAELRGQTDKALELLKQALHAEQAASRPSSEIAWYDSRLGELFFNSGQIDQAAKHFEAAVKQKENFVPFLLGLGQVRAAQSRYADAIALYEEVIKQKPDFDLIGDLATLHSLAGNAEKAKELEAKAVALVPEAAKIETEAHHIALFLADREIMLDQALEFAQKEMQIRQDIHSYDTLAWVLFKQGKTEEAAKAMQEALKLGTKDGKLHFHAGLIAHRQGDHERARRHLQEALKINPHFSFTDPQTARELLAKWDKAPAK